MERVDPFFRSQKPHKNGFIESLHRTYGEKATHSLPTRGDDLYRRAFEYRKKEKEMFAEIERSAAEAKAERDALQGRYDALKVETDKCRLLFEQLSKRSNDDADRSELVRAGADSGATGDDEPGLRTRSTDVHSGGAGEHKPATDSSGGGGGPVHDAHDPGEGAVEAVSGDVPVKVLRRDEHVRGQAAEHTAEGSEPGSGAGKATPTAGADDGLPEDPK